MNSALSFQCQFHGLRLLSGTLLHYQIPQFQPDYQVADILVYATIVFLLLISVHALWHSLQESAATWMELSPPSNLSCSPNPTGSQNLFPRIPFPVPHTYPQTPIHLPTIQPDNRSVPDSGVSVWSIQSDFGFPPLLYEDSFHDSAH